MVVIVAIRGDLELATVHQNGHERGPIGPIALLNLMGAEGWELVSTTALGQTEAAEGRIWMYTLKRPRAAQPAQGSQALRETERIASPRVAPA